MKQFLFLPVFILVSFSAAAQTVTFSAKPLPEGAVLHMIDSNRVDAIMTVMAPDGEQSFDASQNERKRYSKTILATDGSQPVKYRVSYDEVYKAGAQPMRGRKETIPPVTDAAYIFTRLGHEGAENPSKEDLDARRVVLLPEWIVVREDGKEMSKEESSHFSSDRDGSMERSLMRVLDGRTMAVGQTLDFDQEMLAMLETGFVRGDMKPKKVALTLRSLEDSEVGPVAVFDFVVEVSGRASVMEMDAAMEGVLHIGVQNLWPYYLVLTGTMTGAAAHQGATMGLEGDVRLLKQATYELH